MFPKVCPSLEEVVEFIQTELGVHLDDEIIQTISHCADEILGQLGLNNDGDNDDDDPMDVDAAAGTASGGEVGDDGRVRWPLLDSPLPSLPLYTTVFGVPVLGASVVSVGQVLPFSCSQCTVPSLSSLDFHLRDKCKVCSKVSHGLILFTVRLRIPQALKKDQPVRYDLQTPPITRLTSFTAGVSVPARGLSVGLLAGQ